MTFALAKKVDFNFSPLYIGIGELPGAWELFPGPYTDLYGSYPCLEPWFPTHGAHLLYVGPGIASLTAMAARHLMMAPYIS